MINFFRKIRRKFADNNQFFKYSRYAIGEIVLVVIGILIAIQVSNLNEKRKNTFTEQALLTDLKRELQGNIEALKIIIYEHQKSLDAALEVKLLIQDSLRLKVIPIKNLDSILNLMNRNWTFDPKLGILNSTINSGKMDFIKNNVIRYRLSSIKEFIVDASESTQQIENLRTTFYWPLVAINSELSNNESLTFASKKMLVDSQFAWWTKFMILVRKEGLIEENELLKYLKDVNKLLESEIKK